MIRYDLSNLLLEAAELLQVGAVLIGQPWSCDGTGRTYRPGEANAQ